MEPIKPKKVCKIKKGATSKITIYDACSTLDPDTSMTQPGTKNLRFLPFIGVGTRKGLRSNILASTSFRLGITSCPSLGSWAVASTWWDQTWNIITKHWTHLPAVHWSDNFAVISWFVSSTKNGESILWKQSHIILSDSLPVSPIYHLSREAPLKHGAHTNLQTHSFTTWHIERWFNRLRRLKMR